MYKSLEWYVGSWQLEGQDGVGKVVMWEDGEPSVLYIQRSLHPSLGGGRGGVPRIHMVPQGTPP